MKHKITLSIVKDSEIIWQSPEIREIRPVIKELFMKKLKLTIN